MKPTEIKELLDQLDPNQDVYCQMVGQDGSAFSARLSIKRIENGMNVLTLSHPDLLSLKGALVKDWD